MFLLAGSVQAARIAPQPKPRRGNKPRLRSAGTCTSNCKTPPNITPTAIEKMGSKPRCANQGPKPQAHAIVAILSKTGVAAETAKRR